MYTHSYVYVCICIQIDKLFIHIVMAIIIYTRKTGCPAKKT